MHETLLHDAKAILTATPSPHSWDAGFIAMAYAHDDLNRAIQEIRHVFSGQWTNGMLPHTIYSNTSKIDYFPNASFWKTTLSKHSPTHILTAGITTPPIHAMVVWHIYQAAKNKDVATVFLQEMYPKLLAAHRYLYKNRDPLDEGLVSIHHPWESGLNHSPLWDKSLKSNDLPTTVLSSSQIISSPNTANLYDAQQLSLLHLLQKHQYDDAIIKEIYPFQIQDPLFNSLLVWSNECLIEMGHLLGKNIAEIDAWNELTVYSMNDKLWDAERGMYDAFDVFNKEKITCHSSTGLLPLVAGIPSYEDSEIILKNYLYAGFRGDGKEAVWLYPTYNLTAPHANYTQPFRGAIDLSINWLMIQGLRKYNINKLATQLKQQSLELVKQHGFAAYYDPRQSVTKNGYGVDNFSATAAVTIDLLME